MDKDLQPGDFVELIYIDNRRSIPERYGLIIDKLSFDPEPDVVGTKYNNKCITCSAPYMFIVYKRLSSFECNSLAVFTCTCIQANNAGAFRKIWGLDTDPGRSDINCTQ